MRRILLPVAAVVVVLALVAGLWLFQPWRLFTSSTVDEADPGTVPSAPAADPASPEPTPGDDRTPTPKPDPDRSPSARPTPSPKQRDRVLARGTFEDAEHGTSGSAVLRQLADGRRVLRLEDLDTSDGPDLHVWITDQPSGGEWGSYDDGRYVKLGALKANRGNQNYVIPEDAELDGLTSVVIWCDRFDVAFGTAPVDL
ncbi:DM13 domain-containing protein [Microlunatus speluncae]|uniref:DM13 domain-containing protein n=1 Tax=Microlunatus speluncae TaxID=2594267 RepID=UPI001266192A|nr:DM13 domain-containing protein [Microlunatus speluncae]